MRIYLVNPPASNGIQMVREGRCMQRKGAWTTVWPPVTLATIAAMLVNDGEEVKLDDCIVENVSFQQLGARIKQWRPDLIVINTATASIYSDLACADMAKEAYPGARTAVFGLHVTSMAEEAFQIAAGLDYVIRGEPEFCVAEIVQALKNSAAPFERIRGLSYREHGTIKHNPFRGFDCDLNTLPFPAWELIDINKYTLPLSARPFLLITTSKGCPHSCVFCPAKPFYGSRTRHRDPVLVADEIEYVKKRFSVDQFLIWSESFTESRDYTVRLCDEIIRRKLGISWVCNSRVDKVDMELLALMKRAGCWMIGYGIESGDQRILDAARKDITVAQIEKAVAMARAAGLEVTGHVIFGLPGETMSTGLKTIRWLAALGLDYIQVYCAVPWPSSALFSVARAKGWLITGNWALYEQNNSVMDTGKIKPGQVEYLRRLAIMRFYLSPKRAWRIIRKLNSLRKIKAFLALFKEFSSWI